MIGEIRDQPTLQNCLLFAQTGHLCMSTLHANNSYNALNRIINFFPREARDSLLADLVDCAARRDLAAPDKHHGRQAHTGRGNTAQHQAHPGFDHERRNQQIKDALEQSLSPGSQSFEQALFYHINSGRVSVDEAMAHSDSPTNLHWLLNNAPKSTGTPASSGQSPSTTKLPNDITSIKLNLDALG